MNTVGILSIGGACAIGVLIVAIGFYRMYLSAQKAREGYAHATPATAKILKVGRSNSAEEYDTVDVHLTFEVFPPSGDSYQVKNTWSIDPAHVSNFQEGTTVAVRISREDPKKIYSDEKWAQSLDLEQDSLDDPQK